MKVQLNVMGYLNINEIDLSATQGFNNIVIFPSESDSIGKLVLSISPGQRSLQSTSSLGERKSLILLIH
uniref:Uncharacterized protein n=1 Tax=Tetranychus urticae TaxID=32264 RepID=T1KDZ4_TETUR